MTNAQARADQLEREITVEPKSKNRKSIGPSHDSSPGTDATNRGRAEGLQRKAEKARIG